MSRAVMQQALEALERGETKLRWTAITALRAALAEPQTTHWEGCEAVHPECRKPDTDCHTQGICQRSGYTLSPAPRKPLELTDSEVDDLTMAIRNAYPLIVTPLYVWCRHFSRAVIDAYERKNCIAGEKI